MMADILMDSKDRAFTRGALTRSKGIWGDLEKFKIIIIIKHIILALPLNLENNIL